jgi:hypothetical protein
MDSFKQRQQKREDKELAESFTVAQESRGTRLSYSEYAAAARKQNDALGGVRGKYIGTGFYNSQQDAREVDQARSQEAQNADDGQLAPLTLNNNLYEENPGKYDYPGVDTPPEEDLTDEIRSISGFSQERSAANRSSTSKEAKLTGFGTQELNTSAEEVVLGQQDISLAPEEAFDGLGATSSRAAGGFNAGYGGETRPSDEQDSIF